MNEHNINDSKILLERWRTNCLRSQIANYRAASKYSRKNYYLGIPTIILAAAVGTSVFATIGSNVESTIIKLIVGGVSVLASVLAALQTFLKWGELASKHRTTAAEYGSIKRQLDQALAMDPNGNSVQDSQLTEIRTQMDTLSRETPEVPESIWVAVRKKFPEEYSKKP